MYIKLNYFLKTYGLGSSISFKSTLFLFGELACLVAAFACGTELGLFVGVCCVLVCLLGIVDLDFNGFGSLVISI